MTEAEEKPFTLDDLESPPPASMQITAANTIGYGVRLSLIAHAIWGTMAFLLMLLFIQATNDFHMPTQRELMGMLIFALSLTLYALSVGQLLYMLPMMVMMGIQKRYQVLIGLLIIMGVTAVLGLGGGFTLCVVGIGIGY